MVRVRALITVKTQSMSERTHKSVIPVELISKKIYLIRKKKVLLDLDLADFFGVETRRLNEQVKRNIERFPGDFMFQLTKEGFENLKSQFATSSWGGRRKYPYAFTEQGVAMLSGVLHSERAVKVNIQIMRIFIRMRAMLESHQEILRKLESLEKKDLDHDKKIMLIFDYLKELELTKQSQIKHDKRKLIGFKREDLP